MVSTLKNISRILLPAGIAFYVIYPLLTGKYSYAISEYAIYKSFMVNFTETLRSGTLPQWNEYVGSGHPALYFGHYPLSQNTVIYTLFGFNEFTYYFTKFLSLTVLLLSFVYACRYLKLSYFISLIGALVYFSANFTTRFMIEETIGNLIIVYPLLMIFIVKIIDENRKKDILIFSLFYIFWLTGGHIVFEHMYLIMLSLFYGIAIFALYGSAVFKPAMLKRFILLYVILFIIPYMAVLYQYYFIYDVLAASNRLKEGLIISPFEATVWKQLLVSFRSSSYFWVGISLIFIYTCVRLLTIRYGFIETKKIKIPSFLLLLIIPCLFCPIEKGLNFLFKKLETSKHIITTNGHKDNYVLLRSDKKNIIANSEFETNTNSWIAHQAVISSVDSGQARKALQIKTADNAAGYAHIAFPTRTGENYKITACYKNGNSTLGQIKVGTSIDDTTLYYSGVISGTDWEKYEAIFEANTPTTYLTLVNPVEAAKGTTSLFDSVAVYRLNPTSLSDYMPMLKSKVFWVALLLYFSIHLILNRNRFYLVVGFNNFFVFIVYISLLSHYFFSPANINGYNYDLFRELSAFSQVIFILCVLFSLKDYQNNKIVKTVVLAAIALYFIRSHLAIAMLRFSGVLWSTAKDGAIFSFFFAVLFMFGLKNLIADFLYFFKGREKLILKSIQYGLLIFILLLLVRDSFDKFYKGTANRYIYPNKREAVQSPRERSILDGREDVVALNNKLLTMDKDTKHFYRTFTPENSYLYLAGNLQQYKIHEAVIYESSASRQLKDFYNYTILNKKNAAPAKLKDVLPAASFTRHVYAGLNLHYRDIPYGRDIFMFDPKFDDIDYLRNRNIEFLWDIMQVKYLIIGPEFSKVLEGFAAPDYYKLLDNYPKLDLNLYEITKDKSYSKLAVLPLEDRQGYDEAIRQLNSKDIGILKDLYSKLVFLEQGSPDFSLLKNQSRDNKRQYEIASKKDGVLIDFESWNQNWGLKINNEDGKLRKAFQMFKGVRIAPGLNKIDMTYNLKYFRELFLLGVVTILIYATLLGICYHKEKMERRLLL